MERKYQSLLELIAYKLFIRTLSKFDIFVDQLLFDKFLLLALS
jgi:hypothetical protein